MGWWGVLALAILAVPLALTVDCLSLGPGDSGERDGSEDASVGLRLESGLARLLDHLRYAAARPLIFALSHGFTPRVTEDPGLTPPRPRQGFSARQSRTILRIYPARSRSAVVSSASAIEPA